MNTYQKEHIDTYRLVMEYLVSQPVAERRYLRELTADYVDFRKRLATFQQQHIADLCTDRCYQSRLSACCSRDSIVVYFADVVVNCLYSSAMGIEEIVTVLKGRNQGHRCVYLTLEGCRWRISPIVCAMFLCEEAESRILDKSAQTAEQWQNFEKERKIYTWPDRPVVFDTLERRFLDAGLSSPLMHLSTGPGLLSVKRKAGLLK